MYVRTHTSMYIRLYRAIEHSQKQNLFNTKYIALLQQIGSLLRMCSFRRCTPPSCLFMCNNGMLRGDTKSPDMHTCSQTEKLLKQIFSEDL